MSVFAAAMDVIFENPAMAADAFYITRHGEVLEVRVIRREADPEIGYGGSQIAAHTAVFEVRASDVADPRPQDRLMIGTAFFDVQGEPVLDREGLIWTLDTRPGA